MKLWQKFVLKCTTFDSIDDYEGARRVLRDEVRVYRKHWQFVVGMILFFGSAFYLLYALDNWSQDSLARRGFWRDNDQRRHHGPPVSENLQRQTQAVGIAAGII